MKNTPLYLTTFLLCGGSLFCSVGLWVSQQNNLLTMLLAGVFAVALEMCKFLFFPMAKNQWSNNKTTGFFLYSLSTLLLTISIVATVAFLETGSNQTQNSSIISSDKYKILKQETKSIDRQINTINSLMDADLKNGYRQRAYSKSAEIESLRMLKSKSIIKLNSLKQTDPNGIHSLFNSLALMINKPTKQVRQISFTIIAVLIDVCGIVCLLLISSVTTKRCRTLQPVAKTVAKPLQIVTTEPQQHVTTNCNAETLKQKIIAGRYGNRLVMRNIIAKENIRHPELKAIFISLLKDGLLIKNGNAVELAVKAS